MRLRFKNIYSHIDILLALLCIILPIKSVQITERLIIAGHLGSYVNAATLHAVILAMMAAVCSGIRGYRDMAQSSNKLGRLVLDMMVVCVFAVVVYGVNSSAAINAEDIVTPYVSYLISIVFCLGAGYALSDLLKIFIRH
jgi:hypothetical protein